MVAALVARLGPARVAQQITGVGPSLAWLLVAYSAGTAVAALPWYVLLPAPVRPRIRDAIASRFAAAGANALLPLFGVGGEPTRLLWLRPGERVQGLAAIVVDRLLYVMASGVFLLAGVGTLFALHRMPDRTVGLAGAAAAALIALAALGGWVAYRHRFGERIHHLARRLRGKARLTDGDGVGADLDRSLSAILGRGATPLGAALLLHLLARVVLGTEIYAGFVILDLPVSPAEALVFASVPVLLSFVGSVVPSQLGLQEGTLALVAVSFGLPAAGAVAVVLLTRVRQLVTVTAAWLLIAFARRRNRT